MVDLFDTRDRNLILQIPLSSRRDKDVWYWMADPYRLYTVRSYYKMLNNCSIAPTSGIWRKIWNLELPNKVKNFLWRAAMNVLPTIDNLIRKTIEVIPLCSICNHQNESVVQALVNCAFAQTCWLTSSLGLVGPQSSFLNWLEQVFTRYNKEMCNLVAMICWRIWYRRNAKVWNNKVCSVHHVLNTDGNYLFQWQTARQQSSAINATSFQSCHGAIYWMTPLSRMA